MSAQLIWEACLQMRKSMTYHERVGIYYWPHVAADLEYPEGPAECGICTNGARLLVAQFGGHVYGYPIERSDSRKLVGADCYGHDFAIIDNLIVDWWGWEYERSISYPIINAQKAIMRGLYKPRSEWHLVPTQHRKLEPV